MSHLAALICDYLDGNDASVDILNDALEELGRSRLATDGPASTRLQVVLNRVLPDHIVQRIVLDFAEHVSAACNSEEARTLLLAKRRWFEAQPENSGRPYVELFDGLHELGWSDDNSPSSSAAWTIWSALVSPPSYVAAAAQRVRSDELSWQIEHVKKMIMSQS